MTLMLAVILAYILFGLLTPRLGTREHVAIALIAVMMTMTYLLFARSVL